MVGAVACEARGPGFDSSSRPNGSSPRALEIRKLNGSRHDKLPDLAYPCR